jgi:transposase-like protein
MVDTMSVSDFKDEIIRSRQQGATYQAIASRYGCTKQMIEKLLKRWGAKAVLVPTKADRAREAIQLLLAGQKISVEEAACSCGISAAAVARLAKKEGVDLATGINQCRDFKRAHRWDGHRFNGLTVVDGTCVRDEKGTHFVDAICIVCGRRKTFQLSNIKAGYSKTCSRSCGHRYSKGDYAQG